METELEYSMSYSIRVLKDINYYYLGDKEFESPEDLFSWYKSDNPYKNIGEFISYEDGVITYSTGDGKDTLRVLVFTPDALVERLEYNYPRFTLDALRTLPRAFSDYTYLRYFMPKWSTAYNYPHSNHSKVVEPVFSSIVNIGDTLTSVSKSVWDKDVNTITLSNKDMDYLKEVFYIIGGGSQVIDFGKRYNTIYLEVIGDLPEIELVVTGIYNNSFVESVVKIPSKGGYIKLPIPFSVISSIEKTSLNQHLIETEVIVKVTNALNIRDFVTEQRPVNLLSYDRDKNLISFYKKKGDADIVLSLNKNRYEHLFIDKNDNVIGIKEDSVLYGGRLDSKIYMNIPEDISTNNNSFIECCPLDLDRYDLTLYIKNYVRATETDLFSVSIEDSKGDVLRLNKSLGLETGERQWLAIWDLRRDRVNIELEVDPDIEWIRVVIEDHDRYHPVQNVVLQPLLNLVPVCTLPIGCSNSVYLIEDKLCYIKDNTITFLENKDNDTIRLNTPKKGNV